MRKIISSLLFSTATLGGVVGIAAQTNQARSTTGSAAQSPSVKATETTKAVLNVQNITALADSQETEQISHAPLLATVPQSTEQATQAIQEDKTVAYEEIQSIRTGYKPVAPELIEAQSAPVTEPSSIEASVSTSGPKEELAPVTPLNTSILSSAASTPTTSPLSVEGSGVKESGLSVNETPIVSLVASEVTVPETLVVTESIPASPTVPVSEVTTVAETSLAPVITEVPEVQPIEAPVAVGTAVSPSVSTPEITSPTTPESTPGSTTIDLTAPVATSSVETAEGTSLNRPVVSLLSNDRVATPAVSNSANPYPIGQCTWGVKALASWVGNNWGNAGEWANSARAAGYSVGTTPTVGAVAVWPNDGGGYGHVALVTAVESSSRIQVSEANYAGNQSIGNYRGWFNPTDSIWGGGTVYYIYPSI